jgi:protein ImuB
MWFPRLASDRILRARPVDGAFAIVRRDGNTNRLSCLNPAAERAGLNRGMVLADAQAFCPDLLTRPADVPGDARFLAALRRWATRYCPWVGIDGADGLVLDITGSAHLWGGETAMLTDMHQRLARAGLFVRLGLADTRGAAWALARHGEGVAQPGAAGAALAPLPVAALRLEDATVTALQRLGLRTIADLQAATRAPLARRFGQGLLQRLDQAMGHQPESVMPLPDPPHYGVRLSLPEPVGLTADVMAGTERLLAGLCDRLRARDTGARVLCLTLRRVDQGAQQIELRLARAMRDPARILPLFARGIESVDAGYGIDQMRLEATVTEPLPAAQPGLAPHTARSGRLDDLLTRIGTRIGLENVQRFLPADSHIPENSFLRAPAAYAQPGGAWVALRPRPLRLFPPEAIGGTGPRPPERFRWRRMALATARATGPERIAPEWWLADENWRSGMRDYWQVQTRQGRRLWLFYTPQNPGWFVQGEFA